MIDVHGLDLCCARCLALIPSIPSSANRLQCHTAMSHWCCLCIKSFLSVSVLLCVHFCSLPLLQTCHDGYENSPTFPADYADPEHSLCWHAVCLLRFAFPALKPPSPYTVESCSTVAGALSAQKSALVRIGRAATLCGQIEHLFTLLCSYAWERNST